MKQKWDFSPETNAAAYTLIVMGFTIVIILVGIGFSTGNIEFVKQGRIVAIVSVLVYIAGFLYTWLRTKGMSVLFIAAALLMLLLMFLVVNYASIPGIFFEQYPCPPTNPTNPTF